MAAIYSALNFGLPYCVLRSKLCRPERAFSCYCCGGGGGWLLLLLLLLLWYLLLIKLLQVKMGGKSISKAFNQISQTFSEQNGVSKQSKLTPF